MDKKNVVMIVIVVVCLVLAGAFAIKNFGGGGTSARAQGPQSVLCVNPDCGHVFEMTVDERRQIMRERGRQMRRGGPPAFACPQCGEPDSAYQANKCSKCSTVFIGDYSSGDFADRCPECGYSAVEERRKLKEGK
jgi:DNA-directed RNA polymerase subunit M/transcription elongation factor TFIIS